MTTRRDFLGGALAAAALAPALALPPRLAVAAAPLAHHQPPAFRRLMMGDVQITALSDGTVTVPLRDIYNNTRPEHVEEALARVFLPPSPHLSVNAFAVNDGKRLVLIDAGTGDLLGPALGKVPANLKAAGYDPDQVDHILLTHIHADHSGGLARDGRMIFPNATVHVNRRDADHWLSARNLNAATGAQRKDFEQLQETLRPYQAVGRLETFGDDEAPIPGFGSILRAGHTPGHSSIVVEGGGQTFVAWGDIVHGDYVQFDEPGIAIDFDVDSEAAIATRAVAFEDAAQKGYIVAGAHLPFPGIGHVRKDGTGYDWVPLNYREGT